MRMRNQRQPQGKTTPCARLYQRRTKWTKHNEENATRLAASGKFGTAEIAKKLGRSMSAVRLKLYRCGLRANSRRGEDSFSQRQLAKIVRVHRRVIREWESLGLATRPQRTYTTSFGAVLVVRYGFINLGALEEFFNTPAGVDAASRLDNMSSKCLRELIGYDPIQRNQKRVRTNQKTG